MIVINPSNTLVGIKAERIDEDCIAIVVAYIDLDPTKPVALSEVKETGGGFTSEFLGLFQLHHKDGTPVDKYFKKMVQTSLIARRIPT